MPGEAVYKLSFEPSVEMLNDLNAYHEIKLSSQVKWLRKIRAYELHRGDLQACLVNVIAVDPNHI